ncbi:MAG: arsenate reductase (azurin) large subunit [Myxococcales bacterium]|nr:arsenate reductase (azurin) large subunit [Myxococcales bacterium]
MTPRLPVPPRHAERFETVCQYCTVGCGYTALLWPVGREGGARPDANALGADYRRPQEPLLGRVYTEAMHTQVMHRGRRHNLAVVPSDHSPVNPGCEHSSRGGHNARTTFAPFRATRDRLHTPLLKVGGEHRPISWAEAEALLATLLSRLHDELGPDALAAKAFDHGGGGGGFENNWAVGRLFFDVLKMQYVSIHNRPAYNSEVWGSRDRGVHELNSTAQDARVADTLVLWGANSFETASVYFTAHMLPNLRGETKDEKARVFAAGEPAEPTRVVFVDPRRTATVAACQAVDPARVLHLRPHLGTDVVLADAIARVTFEGKLYDAAFLAARGDPETFEAYKQASLRMAEPIERVLADAERVTGVPRAQIELAARWMSAPKAGGARRRTLTLYEKGVIWNQRNYDTVAAVVQLAALGGHFGRPGAGCSRQGGHQEGYVRPAYPGPRPPPNVDAHLMAGGSRLYWVVGTNPYRSTPRAQAFAARIHERASGVAARIDAHDGKEGLADALVEHLKGSDDLFVVVSDLYLTETAKDAHLVFPAAGWGEMDLTSINCNSRLLRLSPRFMDPPGEARPDWQIMANVANAMARRYRRLKRPDDAARCAGFEWQTSEDVFLAGGKSFGDNTVDAAGAEALPAECYAGVDYALLRRVGQAGIATPVRRDPITKALVGTERRYVHRFATEDGRFRWHGSDPWAGYPAEVARYLEGDRAEAHRYWLTTGRNQQWWQTGYHDQRIAQKLAQVPYPYVELHPRDAAAEGLTGGELVELFNEEGRDVFQVKVLDGPPPGTLFALQYHPRGTANALTSGYTDPKTTIPWYKGARVGLRRVAARPDAVPSLLANNELG